MIFKSNASIVDMAHHEFSPKWRSPPFLKYYIFITDLEKVVIFKRYLMRAQ